MQNIDMLHILKIEYSKLKTRSNKKYRRTEDFNLRF